MSVYVIDTIKPKNGGSFPVVEAADVSVSDGKRLTDALSNIPTQDDVKALRAALELKAPQSSLDATNVIMATKAPQTSLDATNAVLATKVSQTSFDSLSYTVANKLDKGELNTEISAYRAEFSAVTGDLQEQINQIETSATAEAEVAPEVVAARVGADGTSYQTLKTRLDAETNSVNTEIATFVNGGINVNNTAFMHTGKQLFDAANAKYHGYYNSANNKYTANAEMSGYYCLVKGMTKVTVNAAQNVNLYCAFLTDKRAVISIEMPVTPGTTFNVPSSAYYFFISTRTTNVNSVIVNEGTSSIADKTFKPFIDAINNRYENILTKAIATGTNLYNKNNTIKDYVYFYSTGVLTAASGYYASAFIPAEPGESYGFNTRGHICFFDENKDYISGDLNLGEFTAYTAPANTAYVAVSTNSPNTCMLSKGSEENAFEPYYETLRYGSASETKKPYAAGYIYKKFTLPGKRFDTDDESDNLFDKTTAVEGYIYYYADGRYLAQAGYSASALIEIAEHRSYSLNVIAHVCFFDANHNFIAGHINPDEYSIFKAPTNAKYIAISIRNGALDTCSLQTIDTATNTAYLRLPDGYTADGEPTKLCILMHGASMGISDDGSTGWTYNEAYDNIVNKLLVNGYAVIDSNGYNDDTTAGHNHWGCQQAINGYIDAYTYFTNNYNLDKNAYIYGFSMGGLTALTIMINGSIPIRCGAVGAPVISLYDQCVSGRVQSPNPDFLEAYGMAAYSADKCRGYDRYPDIININNTPYNFKSLPPIFCAYGSNDTNISNTKIHEYFAALQNANNEAEIKSYTGGHEISYGFNNEVLNDIVSFFNYY